MKRIALFMAMPALFAACSKNPETAATTAHTKSNAAVQANIEWLKPEGASLDAVFAKAKADNKPVFLYWGAVWCPPCNQIKATVFNRPDFVAGSKAFIPVYLDGDTLGAQKLGTQFKVRGYPTTILFKPDGTELTRLPGEVDAAQYMQVLKLGLASTQPIRETLLTAMAGPIGGQSPLSADAWRLLAFYSWDTDEAQLLPTTELVPTLMQLAKNCPPQYEEASTRLGLRSLVLAAGEKGATVDKIAGHAMLLKVLDNETHARQNSDILTYNTNELVNLLTAGGSPERAQLLTAVNATLDRFSGDPSLSKADQLGAVQAKVGLAKIEKTTDAKHNWSADMLAQAQDAARKADRTATDRYERQAVIPSAAHLLSEVGLVDASDAMLKAELPKAISPYYHMLVLASNAKRRGDKLGALDWAEKAYAGSVGPATRLQWGSGYVAKLIDMAPEDSERIKNAASQVIGELDAAPETFYERNRRSLEKMGAQIHAWNADGKHTAVVQKLSSQLKGVCEKLPEADTARAACTGVFDKRSKKV